MMKRVDGREETYSVSIHTLYSMSGGNKALEWDASGPPERTPAFYRLALSRVTDISVETIGRTRSVPSVRA